MSSITTEKSGYLLPKLSRVTLRNFSLFDHAPTISANFGGGVFCLAGANGLGKSTFLAALNFGITGIVPDKDRRFESPPEYYRYSLKYSADYFRGRITNKDREMAEVELEMDVGQHHYRLVRNMFEPSALRELTITSTDPDHNYVQTVNDQSIDDADRHKLYTQSITADCGFNDFSQLVFLQHFVLTFDERRHLLFWDDKVTQSALFIAFGLDPERAKRADVFRRNYERADSLAKNLQWQTTEARKRSEDLEATFHDRQDDEEDVSRTVDDHHALIDELDAATAHEARLMADLRDARLQLDSEVAKLDIVRAEYDRQFRRVMLGRTPPSSHPVISESVQGARCAVCGTEGPAIAQRINSRLEASVCPLCDSDLHQEPGLEDEQHSILRLLDEQLNEGSAGTREAMLGVELVTSRLEELRAEMARLRRRITDIESANQAALTKRSEGIEAIQGIINQYRSQIDEFQQRKKVELEKRNQARRELKELQDQLARAYAATEDEFVPRFTNLAREFLGIDLSVRLDANSTTVQLVLTVENTPRRAEDTLSESQRFFIDIALRMALVQQIAGPGKHGTLYIDTPEGSLDIAYESRAGSMFGLFVKDGNQLIMTANINTSQLLRRLAATCGRERMTLLRMTEWTSLSEVQSAAEVLFDQAYGEIEAALERGE